MRAPILLGGKPAGVMVAMSTEREFVFEQRDLDVLVTAAGQVSVAVENARLFAEEQRRSRQLAFLNNISRTAISSDDPVHMLGQIVGEIQKNFSFDHIGIGLLDYGTKEIEIKAEAGATAHAMGKRIPLGVGHSGPRGAHRRAGAGAERDAGQIWRDPAGVAVRVVHSDHVRRNAAGRAQYRKPQRETRFRRRTCSS